LREIRAVKTDLEIAVGAVSAACRLCSAVAARREKVAAATKKDRSPVTVADYASQAAVCRILAEERPGDAVLAEEHPSELLAGGGAELEAELLAVLREGVEDATDMDTVCRWLAHGRGREAPRAWILDPVDGTKGFLRGEQYAVALALRVEGRLELGVLGCPNLPDAAGDGSGTGWLFLAERGGGAYTAPLADPAARRSVRVSAPEEMGGLVLVESVESGHADHDAHAEVRRRLGAEREPVRMDSQAKYGVVARGEASVYLRLPNPGTPEYREKAWDHAAGALIVTEAGGRVTDARGRDLDFSAGERLAANRGVVATCGRFHEAVLAAVSGALGG
jgi:3'(2'), 5'-bisphosphate nucleotidase